MLPEIFKAAPGPAAESERNKAEEEAMADLILVNGSVWTNNSRQPWAEAVVVRGAHITYVGAAKDIPASDFTSASVIDLHGGLVLPGFIDCHTHFLEGGFSLESLQLADVRSREEFITRVEAKAREMDSGQWILKGEWDQELLDPPELPHRNWIDAVTPRNPACLNRHDLHMVLANSLALQAAGITRDTPSPCGGEIRKDLETGEPTGILTDAAMDLVLRHVPQPSFEEKIRAAQAALRLAARRGLTSVHDMGDASHFEIFQELLRREELTCRISLYFPMTEVGLFTRLKMATPFGGEFLRISGLKSFVDGSLGSETALFFDPYTDDPGHFGLFHSQMFPEGEMEERIAAADRAHIQLAVHAIGDRANAVLLDMFERVTARGQPRDRRWRVEHAQHLRMEDVERLGRLGIIASVQPYHALDDGCWAEKKIGRKRCRFMHMYQTLLRNGVRLVFGSDWTVAPLDPLVGIYAAVTRRTLDGKNPEGWIREEKITVEDAVKAYTLDAAYAEFDEGCRGSIEERKLADLVILDRNIFGLPPEKIPQARVVMTIVNGQIVFQE